MDIVKSPIECLDLFNYGIYFSLLFLASSQLNTFILGMPLRRLLMAERPK